MPRQWSTRPEIHRVLFVDPGDLMRGEDVENLRSACDRRLERRGHDGVAREGGYGPGLTRACALALWELGAPMGAVEDARKGTLSKRAQRIIRNPGTRTPTQLARAVARRDRPSPWSDGKVRRPYEWPRLNVRNQSSRGGVKPRLIVLHSTEGDNEPGRDDLHGLGSWFDNPVAQVSSHAGVDAAGNSARYVRDGRKAWTQRVFNPQALSIEQIGHASQTSWPDAQIDKVAKYLAYWSRRHGIPLRHSTERGVCEHKDLGAAGGGHHDCGEHYPLSRVIRRARYYAEHGW